MAYKMIEHHNSGTAVKFFQFLKVIAFVVLFFVDTFQSRSYTYIYMSMEGRCGLVRFSIPRSFSI